MGKAQDAHANPDSVLRCPFNGLLQVNPESNYPAKKASITAFNLACSDSCAKGEASASAMARTTACALNRITGACGAVDLQVRHRLLLCAGAGVQCISPMQGGHMHR